MEYYTLLTTPIGILEITANDTAITAINQAHPKAIAHKPTKTTSLLQETISQLQAYFERRLTSFSLPLQPQGSPFELQVWEALRHIPYGHTSDYKGIAKLIGNPKAYRAVGNANHKNPIIILIPCHRIVKAGFQNQNLTPQNLAKIGGYALGTSIKRQLLSLEGIL